MERWILWVGCATGRRYRPLVLSDAGPENPDHDYRQQREECFKQRAVDLARGRLAKMRTDDVLEDLTDCEQQAGDQQVH